MSDSHSSHSLKAWVTPEKIPELPTQVQQHGAIDSSFDGGPRAWATLFGGFLAINTTFGYAGAFGVYQDVYTRAGVATASQVSWIGSTQIFLLLAAGIIGGKLLDMGHFRPTLLVASLLQVFFIFMISLAHHDKYYQIYLAQGVGLGISSGLIYVPCLAIQGQHWKKRRALAMGFVAAGSGIGGIVFPIMLNQLFKSSVGFAWGVRASGFLVLGLLTLSNILMSENPTLQAIAKPKPDVKSILTDLPFMLVSFAGLFMNLSAFFPYFYTQLYAILHTVDPNTAFYMLATINAASVLGRTIPAYYADRFGPLNLLIPTCLGSAVLVLAMLGLKSSTSIIVFCILYGFFSGAVFSLTSPVMASLCRDPAEFGVRFGIGYACTALGALAGNPISGALLGPQYDWWKACVFNSIMMLGGVSLLIIARQMYVKQKRTSFL